MSLIKNVGVIDIGIGNVESLCRALRKIGAKPIKCSNSYDLINLKALFLPGVGNFDAYINKLKYFELFDVIKNFTDQNSNRLIGICLGMQVLFSKSNEGSEKGLDLIQGSVKKFKNPKAKLPHMGWNKVIWNNEKLDGFFDIKDHSWFYFAHSFYGKPEDNSLSVGMTNGPNEFCSVIKKDNIIGLQFHPEKSGVSGIKLIKKLLDENLC
jgi:glutamine amidotransferase